MTKLLRDSWEANAEFWDAMMGEGNAFYKDLVEPTVGNLLEVETGWNVLDLACGNGVFSRFLAKKGAKVVAADFSRQMLNCARGRLSSFGDAIRFEQIDAASLFDLERLRRDFERFDAIVCNMALMDIADIKPLAENLVHLLRTGGRFVFSICHPCFNSAQGARLGVEQVDRDGEVVVDRYVRVSSYKRPESFRGVGAIGQPEPQHYFHRSLSELLSVFFSNGFVMDALQEPTFETASKGKATVAWTEFTEVPPVLACRLVAR